MIMLQAGMATFGSFDWQPSQSCWLAANAGAAASSNPTLNAALQLRAPMCPKPLSIKPGSDEASIKATAGEGGPTGRNQPGGRSFEPGDLTSVMTWKATT